MTMKIGANDIFKVKTQKNLIFHDETGQDKTKPKLANKPKIRSQIEKSQTNPKLGNKPDMCKQTQNLEIYAKFDTEWASVAILAPLTQAKTNQPKLDNKPETRKQTQSSQTE